MNWKNWPYWLRGGVIGGGVAFVYIIFINYICSLFPVWDGGFQCGAVVFFFGPLYPVTLLMDIIGPVFPYWKYPSVYGDLEVVVLSVFIGAVIGSIVGYSKEKKKSSPQV